MLNYLVWLLFGIMYLPVFQRLFFGRTNWALEDFSHIYFILPISLFLIWRKRSVLKKVSAEQGEGNIPAVISFVILLAGIFIFVFGWRGNYDMLQIFSLVPVLFGLTGYLYGGSVLKVLSFPYLYLLFLVPPPAAILDSITLPMRHGVSSAAESILGLFNYPVTREGLLLSIGYRDIYMAPACSGFRSLVTMLSLSLVYIYLTKGGLLKKTVLTLFTVPLALSGNLIRVITLCLITFYFGEEAGQGFFHNFSGIVIFMITILGLIGVEIVIDRLIPEEDGAERRPDE
jgi:exosortase